MGIGRRLVARDPLELGLRGGELRGVAAADLLRRSAARCGAPTPPDAHDGVEARRQSLGRGRGASTTGVCACAFAAGLNVKSRGRDRGDEEQHHRRRGRSTSRASPPTLDTGAARRTRAPDAVDAAAAARSAAAPRARRTAPRPTARAARPHAARPIGDDRRAGGAIRSVPHDDTSARAVARPLPHAGHALIATLHPCAGARRGPAVRRSRRSRTRSPCRGTSRANTQRLGVDGGGQRQTSRARARASRPHRSARDVVAATTGTWYERALSVDGETLGERMMRRRSSVRPPPTTVRSRPVAHGVRGAARLRRRGRPESENTTGQTASTLIVSATPTTTRTSMRRQCRHAPDRGDRRVGDRARPRRGRRAAPAPRSAAVARGNRLSGRGNAPGSRVSGGRATEGGRAVAERRLQPAAAARCATAPCTTARRSRAGAGSAGPSAGRSRGSAVQGRAAATAQRPFGRDWIPAGRTLHGDAPETSSSPVRIIGAERPTFTLAPVCSATPAVDGARPAPESPGARSTARPARAGAARTAPRPRR